MTTTALGDADRRSVPALNRMFLRSRTQQLHPSSRPIRMPPAGAEADLASVTLCERQTLPSASDAPAPGDVELDRDVGAHERHRCDERSYCRSLALLQYTGIYRSQPRRERYRPPAPPGPASALNSRYVAGFRPRPPGVKGPTPESSTWPNAAPRIPMLGSALTVTLAADRQ